MQWITITDLQVRLLQLTPHHTTFLLQLSQHDMCFRITPCTEPIKVRERLGVVDATVELWLRRSAGMAARGSSESDTDMLQVQSAMETPG